MIFLNESMVNEIVVESNNTITLEQFDYFRESTYYSINQLIVEAEIGMVLNEGKIMDTIKAIIRKIKELFQRFFGWVAGLFRKAKNAIFGRKKNLEKIKKDVNTQAEEARKQGKKYIVLRGPKLKESDNTQDASDNESNNAVFSSKSQYKIDINIYDINDDDTFDSYTDKIFAEYEYLTGGRATENAFFIRKSDNDTRFASNKGVESIRNRFNELNELKYEFNLKDTQWISKTEEKVSNNIYGFNKVIDKMDSILKYQEMNIDELKKRIDIGKKWSFDPNIPEDATDEQKKNLLERANILSNLSNLVVKKTSELLDFEIRRLTIVDEKNTKELDKFTTLFV